MSEYTREQYIEDRKNSSINYYAAWEFYNLTPHSSPKVDNRQFVPIFDAFLKSGIATMEYFFDYYDSKFELIFIYNKQNQLISIK